MDRKVILYSAALTSFMTAFMSSAINIALPGIGKEFNITAVIISWTATSYLLVTAAFVIPAGKISDIFGRTKLFKIGFVVFLFGSLLCGLSFSGWTLIAARVIQGLGSAMIFSTYMALVVSAYPANERGRVVGITTASVYIGLSSGPFIGGIISNYLGWRYIFFFTVLFGILLGFFIFTKIKEEWTEAKGEKLDIQGAVLLAAFLIVLMLGFSFLPGAPGIILILISFILAALLYQVEKRKEFPVFNITMFIQNRTFAFSNVAALINYSATFAVGFLMSFYLQTVKGLSPQAAGLILVTQPVMMALFSPLSGKLSDKIEPQRLSSIGMALITVCLLIFAFLNETFSYTVVVGNLAFLGFGFALFSSPNTNAVMGSIEKRYYGVGSSTLSSMRMIGQMLSMGIVIIIFSVIIGNSQITPSNSDKFLLSARSAFMLFSFLCFLGIFASLSRGKIHNV